MPRVKVDYVVSFSNEDPENQASNLLSWDVSKKRWLCKPGEPSCSVVLQLARAVKICSLQVGLHHAATLEVLAGRSETPSEPFQVLVPCSVVLSPAQSRAAAPPPRVRSWGAAAFTAAAAQRWDRLRLVCSQPYNKHCKYGISFIHVFEPDDGPAPCHPAPDAPDAPSSDEEFRPGELFAKYRQDATDTGAQIRQATFRALKNDPEAATQLVKTPLPTHRPPDGPRPPAPSREETTTSPPKRKVHPAKADKTAHYKRGESSTSTSFEPDIAGEAEGGRGRTRGRSDGRDRGRGGGNEGERELPAQHTGEPGSASETNGRRTERARAGAPGGRPLQGVVFALSGYQNPERARLRDVGAALGARYRRDWGPLCTHLIKRHGRRDREGAPRPEASAPLPRPAPAPLPRPAPAPRARAQRAGRGGRVRLVERRRHRRGGAGG